MALSADSISGSAIAAEAATVITKRPPPNRVAVAKPDAREVAEPR